MPIKIKNGAIGSGSWVGPLGDGRVHVKDGGIGSGKWVVAGLVRIKDGGIGAGAWKDSEYRGEPRKPSGIAVHAWDNTYFNNISIEWDAPAPGGALIDHYELEMRGQYEGLLATKYPTSSPSSNFVVGPDDKIQFRVRSVSPAELNSEWTYWLQVLMGHRASGSLNYKANSYW